MLPGGSLANAEVLPSHVRHFWQAWKCYIAVPVASVEALHYSSCGKYGGVALRFLWQAWRCYIAVPVANMEVLH